MKKIGNVLLSTGFLLGAALLPFVPVGAKQAEAATSVKMNSVSSQTTVSAGTVKFTKTTYQTTSILNLRSGAGTGYKSLYKLPKGGMVTSSERKNQWYHVSYTYFSKGKKLAKSGWVSGSYLKEYDQFTATSVAYYFTKKTTSLYLTPDKKKSAAYHSAAGNGLYSTQKVINSIGQTWYRVSYNGKTLYVYSGDVSKYTPKTFAKTSYKAKADTYVYASPGSSNPKLVKVPKGVTVSSAKSVGSWYAVTYKGKTGFVLSKYLQKVSTGSSNNNISKETLSGDSYLVTADSLNLRQGYTTLAHVLTVIPRGTTVTSNLKLSNGWYLVSYNGKTGYVSGAYLRKYDRKDDYRFIDLRTSSPVTAVQINSYIAKNVKGRSSVLTSKGQAFINAGKKYGVNALYLAAHAIHESNFGMSGISIGKNNLFGYGAYDITPFVGAYRFAKVEDCINYVAQKMKADYLNPNGTHFQGPFLGYRTNDSSRSRISSKSVGMNYYYASDPNWGNAIARHMQNILSYNKAYYDKAGINKTVPAIPGIPAGGEKFPAGIQAVAKATLSSTIKKGSTFVLLEKSNDYKIKVAVGKKQSWIGPIAFSNYDTYFSALNLGRVTASALNVRSSTSTANNNNVIGQLRLNKYVQLVLDKKGKIVMDSKKAWYQIKMSNGKPGWVSAQYIYLELQ